MSHWVYHPKEEAKIVGEQEYRHLLNNGWYDSPAKCLNHKLVVQPFVAEKKEEVVSHEEVIQEVKKRGRPAKVV